MSGLPLKAVCFSRSSPQYDTFYFSQLQLKVTLYLFILTLCSCNYKMWSKLILITTCTLFPSGLVLHTWGTIWCAEQWHGLIIYRFHCLLLADLQYLVTRPGRNCLWSQLSCVSLYWTDDCGQSAVLLLGSLLWPGSRWAWPVAGWGNVRHAF